MRITTWTGYEMEGIVLSITGTKMRVAVPGCPDACEFNFQGGHWFAEDGVPVTIASWNASAEPELDSLNGLSERPPFGPETCIWLN